MYEWLVLRVCVFACSYELLLPRPFCLRYLQTTASTFERERERFDEFVDRILKQQQRRGYSSIPWNLCQFFFLHALHYFFSIVYNCYRSNSFVPKSITSMPFFFSFFSLPSQFKASTRSPPFFICEFQNANYAGILLHLLNLRNFSSRQQWISVQKYQLTLWQWVPWVD